MSTGCDLPGTLRTGAPSKYAEKRCASNVAEDTTHRNLIPSFLNATAAFTTEQDVRVHTPLVGLVQHDGPVLREAAVAHALPHQDTVRHEGQLRGPLGHAVEAHLVADLFASQRRLALLRDAS